MLNLMKRKTGKPAEYEEEQLRRELLNDYFQTLMQLHDARAAFEHATDPELVNACVFEINSLQQKYSYLLQKIRSENLTCSCVLR